MHNYNIVPHPTRYLLVHGSYQSGTALVDFTDPTNAYEVAWMDPDPLDPPSATSPGGRTNFRGGDWSSYWYNGSSTRATRGAASTTAAWWRSSSATRSWRCSGFLAFMRTTRFRAVRAAAEMRDGLAALNGELEREWDVPMELGSGEHGRGRRGRPRQAPHWPSGTR